jgi:hypothetical protein
VLFNPAAIDWRDARALGGNALILGGIAIGTTGRGPG